MNTQTQTTDYQQQAIDFLNKVGATISIKYLRASKYFPNDKEERDIYEVCLKKGSRSYTFTFGQSVANSGFYYQYKTSKTKFPLDRKYLAKDYFKGKSLGLIGTIKMRDSSFVPHLDILHYPQEPTAYDILACITKNDPGTFENFCSDFGYDTDSRNAETTYEAVKEEYLNISRLFNEDEINELQEIQ